MNYIKKLIYTITGFLLFTIAGPVNAETTGVGLFVDPAVTYESGQTSTTYPAPFSNASGTSNGLGIGARLAFK